MLVGTDLPQSVEVEMENILVDGKVIPEAFFRARRVLTQDLYSMVWSAQLDIMPPTFKSNTMFEYLAAYQN